MATLTTSDARRRAAAWLHTHAQQAHDLAEALLQLEVSMNANTAKLTDPQDAPVGTTVLWPARHSDAHPLPEVVIRWSSPLDDREPYPWLILGSEGPQRLSHESVRDCTVLYVSAAEAVAVVAEQSAG